MRFSIIVVFNQFRPFSVKETLDSIFAQTHEALETIVVTSDSAFMEQDFFEEHRSKMHKIEFLQSYTLAPLLNRGIELAEGDYLHFLRPSEFYLGPSALSLVNQELEKQNNPQFLECGFIQRKEKKPLQITMEPLSLKKLQRGDVSRTYQAYFFKKEIFSILGQFNISYRAEDNYDFLCRIYCNDEIKKVFMRRVITDYKYQKTSPREMICETIEKFKVIFRYYGFFRVFLWLFAQSDVSFIRLFFRLLKEALWKERHEIE